MKKLIVVILIFAMILPAAVIAEGMASMSDQELKDAIAMYSRELASRHTNQDGWVLIFEYESVQVYQVGEARIGSSGIITVPVAVIMSKSGLEESSNTFPVYSVVCVVLFKPVL